MQRTMKKIMKKNSNKKLRIYIKSEKKYFFELWGKKMPSDAVHRASWSIFLEISTF